MERLLLVLLAIGSINSLSIINKRGCKHLQDIVVVVDGSESIFPEDFQIIRDVMVNFVDELELDATNKQFGLVVFSTDVTEVTPLSGDRESLKAAMQSLHQPRAGTRTDLGIKTMIETFQTGGRSGVPKIGIVITDGESHERDETQEQAQIAKDLGINMYAVGVGGMVNNKELKGIASSDDRAFTIDNFDGLAEIIEKFIKEDCPTSTTITTTTTTTVAPTPSPHGPCDGCRMSNGIGYNVHADCNKYVQCSFNDKGIPTRYVVKTCGSGTFWSQDKLTCDHMKNVNCPNDPCKTRTLVTYKLGGSCADYVQCINGQSAAATCGIGYSYDETNYFCMKDASCVVGEPGVVCNKCEFRKVPNDKCKYYWLTPLKTYTMSCPPGTAFSESSCMCEDARRDSCAAKKCQTIVDIDFNSAEEGEYDNYGAVVKDGKAYFDGNSNIKILRLANMDFRSTVTIKVAYKLDGDAESESQAIVTNGDCGEASTISISSKGPTTTFSLQNIHKASSAVHIFSTASWRTAVLKVENEQLTGTVNSGESSAPVLGLILRSQCAFQLGHGEGLKDFKGWIDYIIVSTC